MIVPLSLSFSADFDSTRKLLTQDYSRNWFSSFGRIPAALFSHDVRVRNTVHIGAKGHSPSINYSTRLYRWFEGFRPHLVPSLEYACYTPSTWSNRIPKIGNQPLMERFEFLLMKEHEVLGRYISTRRTKHSIYFKKSAYNWLNFCREMPPCYDSVGTRIEHTQFGDIFFDAGATRDAAVLAANGKIMFVFWIAIGDDFHVTKGNFEAFPFSISRLDDRSKTELLSLLPELEGAMEENTQFKLNAGKRVGNFNLAKCRHVTDKSDKIVLSAMGMSDLWEDIELMYGQTVRTDFGLDEDADE